jgi:hypothetical protein
MLLASVQVHAQYSSDVGQHETPGEVVRQTMEDAWWTGPLLAASASTLPRGHVLVEPYLFDVITYGAYDQHGRRASTPHANDFGSQSYLLYGLMDRVSVGLIPRFGYQDPSQGPASTGIGVGDLSVQAQYRLTQFQEGHCLPTSSLLLAETLPTGRYDRLDGHPADGFGVGAHTTTVSLYIQQYLWLSNGRILRTRLDLSYGFSDRVALQGVSVYGTTAGFHGRARPGNSFTTDSSWEYSLTTNWVLALDVVYAHTASTGLAGSYSSSDGVPASLIQQSSGASHSLGFAPAIEYNWTSRIGIIAGVRSIPIGRNTSISVTPVAALNMVF